MDETVFKGEPKGDGMFDDDERAYWMVRENVRAQLRVIVKRILRKHGYPPDKQEKATQTVLEQAEVLCAEAGS